MWGGWKKSSYSASNGHCVEAAGGAVVQVRDSRDPDGPRLTFSAAVWREFTDRIKAA